MNILGIETSCDETSVAVVRDGCFVLSNVVASSVKEHAQYGGVIPEIASRRQLEFITPVVQEALSQAQLSLDHIDAIAVTVKPGLIGSLLIGMSFARGLAYAYQKPLIEVDHIQAHVYANRLVDGAPNSDTKRQQQALPAFPAIGLVVSGGHSSLFFYKNELSCKELGATRDDAIGEAFDKVARIMDLGYPGGPVIDHLAASAQPDASIIFKSANIKDSYDFSFSGVKTAVLYYMQKHPDADKAAVALAFQESVVDVVVKKTCQAARDKKVKTIMVGGGVAANSMLRDRLTAAAARDDIQVSFPTMTFCLDNGAMIAGLAYHLRSS